MFDPITVLTSLIPFLTYAGRRIVDKYTGGAKPQSAQDMVLLMQAETERLKTLAQLDSSDNISRGVANIRALQRPIAVAIILFTWSLATIFPGLVSLGMYEIVCNIASSAMFYLFGDRTMMYLDTRFKK